MENQEMPDRDSWKKIERTHRRGKIMGGLLIVAIGALFLGRELGMEIPVWVFSWKMLLIGLGVVAAIKHKFLHPGWIVLVGVGGAFLLCDLYPELSIKPIIWPVALIIVGLFIIFKPRRKYSERMRRHWGHWHNQRHHQWRNMKHEFDNDPTSDDYIESTVFMAAVKKNIVSKKFRGGEVTNVFGGTELNLMQADIETEARLELTQVFGGTKLIVPANWEIKSELVTVMGSVEDKRPVQPAISQEKGKVLVLTGDTVMGGIEIRSY